MRTSRRTVVADGRVINLLKMTEPDILEVCPGAAGTLAYYLILRVP